MLPVGSRIGANQQAPKGAILTTVLFTSFSVLRQRRVRLRLGDTPELNGCRFNDLIEEGPTVEAAACCLVRSRLVATEPQWPRMNPSSACSLRTRHSLVTSKIDRKPMSFLTIPPASLPAGAL